MKTAVNSETKNLLAASPADFWSYVSSDSTVIKGSFRYGQHGHHNRVARQNNGSSVDAGDASEAHLNNIALESNPLSGRVEELFKYCQPYLQVWFLKNKLTELKIALSAAAESDLKSIRMFDSHGLSRSQELIDKLINEAEGVSTRLDGVFEQAFERFRIKASEEISATISEKRLEKILELKLGYEISFRHEQNRLAAEAVQNIRDIYEQSTPANWQVLRNRSGRQRQFADLSTLKVQSIGFSRENFRKDSAVIAPCKPKIHRYPGPAATDSLHKLKPGQGDRNTSRWPKLLLISPKV